MRFAGRVVVLLLAGCVPTAAPRAGGLGPPNILLVLTDDQGWPTLGCYGGTRVPTPNLDRWAAEGVRFTDAYVQPQCTPTRASLLTGQHVARNGMWHVIPWYGYPGAPVAEPPFVENLPRRAFTLAKGLREAGYDTGIFGKWHLTHNEDGNYASLEPAAAAHFGFEAVAPALPKACFEEGGDRGVDALTDAVIRFMEKPREGPFFAYLSHHMIHGKVVAPRDLVAAYRARGAPESGMFNATYLAALDHLDRSIGRLDAALDRLRIRENTLVVFLSDNGGVDERYGVPAGPAARLEVDERQYDNAPLRAGKGSMYEGGIRVPLIVRGPGVARGATSRSPVHVVDVMPTLLEAAGTAAPAGHVTDGVPLNAELARPGSSAERALVWHLPLYDLRWGLTPCAMIRRGDWKLIEFFGDRVASDGTIVRGAAVELYDLGRDVGETRDLAASMQEKAAALRAELRGVLATMAAPIPGPNPRLDAARPYAETRRKPDWLR